MNTKYRNTFKWINALKPTELKLILKMLLLNHSEILEKLTEFRKSLEYLKIIKKRDILKQYSKEIK